MRILLIANKAIYPPDGGSLAILNMAKGYIKNGHEVYLLNMVTHKHLNNINLIEKEYFDNLTIEGITVNTRISTIKLTGNLFFSKKPYIAQRFVSKKFRKKILHLIQTQKFDLIQLEGLYVLQYIKSIKEIFKGYLLYRPHNLEYFIWQRNYKESSNLFKRFYFRSLSKRLKRLEKQLLNTYDYILPISETDAKTFIKLGNKKPLKVAPFGINVDKIAKNSARQKNEITPAINYIGALDWIPNQKGLLWFVENCLPVIVKDCPKISFNIAGRNASREFIKTLNHPNINFLGEIEDAYDFLRNPGPVVVPLFSGSGMRVKIIESMALKKAVIATSIAAEGIHCTDKNNILLADTIHDFSEAVVELLKNRELEEQIGENALNFVKKEHDLIKIAADIETFIN